MIIATSMSGDGIIYVPILQKGRTALMIASWEGQTESLQLLLGSGTDCNQHNKVRVAMLEQGLLLLL